MLKSLHIRNYGANKKLDIKFSPGITCICGESYQGKSYVIRAIKWAALNKPSGKRFIAWGTKQTTVCLKTKTAGIIRKRSNTLNTYKYNKHTLKAFGNNVPALVENELNLSELNFQTQQESPLHPGNGPLFWFALTPGQVSKQLNKIVDLEIIDRTLANLKRKKTHANTNLNVCKKRVSDARDDYKKYKQVPALLKAWGLLEKKTENLNTLRDEYDELLAITKAIAKKRAAVEGAKGVFEGCADKLNTLGIAANTIIDLEDTHDTIEDIVSGITMKRKVIAKLKQQHACLKRKYDKAMQERCPLCQTKPGSKRIV